MRLCYAVLILILTVQFASAQGRHAARSMVISRYGIVATTHVQASQAGAEILRQGGSAVDAAIAACARAAGAVQTAAHLQRPRGDRPSGTAGPWRRAVADAVRLRAH